jgi:hypothetical protein
MKMTDSSKNPTVRTMAVLENSTNAHMRLAPAPGMVIDTEKMNRVFANMEFNESQRRKLVGMIEFAVQGIHYNNVNPDELASKRVLIISGYIDTLVENSASYEHMSSPYRFARAIALMGSYLELELNAINEALSLFGEETI